MLAKTKRAWKGGMPAARQGRIKPPWLWEPLSRRDLAAWVMLRPLSVPAVPCSGEPRDAPGCRSSPVGGMLPLVHPFPVKSRPPSARDTPGTATLPGNSSCCRRRARGIPTANVPGRQVWAAPAACVLRWVPAMGWVPSRAQGLRQGMVLAPMLACPSAVVSGRGAWNGLPAPGTRCHPRRADETGRRQMTDPGGIFITGLENSSLAFFFFSPPYFFPPCKLKRLQGGGRKGGSCKQNPLL